MRVLFCAAALTVLSACADVGIVSRPYLAESSWVNERVPDTTRVRSTGVRSAAAADYVTYKLPVTVLDLTATYEVRTCPAPEGTTEVTRQNSVFTAASVDAPDKAIALVSVTIEPSVRADPDPHNWFDVDANDWSGFAVGLAEAKLELNSDQVLTSVNYRSQPQFTQTVTSLVRLASVASGSMLLSGDGFATVPCSASTYLALRRRAQQRALVEALDNQIATLDLTIATAPTRANAQQRGRLIEMRNAALLRILDLRDNELRFSVRYRWLPQADALDGVFPAATDVVSAIAPSQFAIGDNSALRENLRRLLTFHLQLRPEPQFEMTLQRGFAFEALPASCQLLNVAPGDGAGAPGSARLAGSQIAATQFAGVYHRVPVRVRPILVREAGVCREMGWGASAPLVVSILQLGPLQRIPIEGSAFFARSRGATWTNGALSSISAGANDATGPAVFGAAADLGDLQRQIELSEIARDTAELSALTALAKAREAYDETRTPPPPTTPQTQR